MPPLDLGAAGIVLAHECGKALVSEPGLGLSVSRWQESLPLGREWLGQPLYESLEAFLAGRFPLAVVSEGAGGRELPEREMEFALGEVLR